MKGRQKVAAVMHEYKAGTLHSGAKSGPVVRSRDQAVAIAMHEAGMGMRPRNRLAKSKRLMRDRATKGSPPMQMPEFRQGYRRLG